MIDLVFYGALFVVVCALVTYDFEEDAPDVD
jgi:hypothetical protein